MKKDEESYLKLLEMLEEKKALYRCFSEDNNKQALTVVAKVIAGLVRDIRDYERK